MPATPASPPKRMTRARAKAVEEKKKQAGPSSAKPSLQKETASSRARSKAAAADNDTQKSAPSLKKAPATTTAAPRSRQAASTKPSTSQTAAKNAEHAEDTDADELGDAIAAPAASTRAKTKKQPSTTATKQPARATRNTKPATKAATQKRVAFEDNKENNVQQATKEAKESLNKPKPSSKTASEPKPNLQSREAKHEPEVKAKAEHSEPLSPKKGFQTSADAQPSSRPSSSDKDTQKPSEAMFSSPAKRSLHVRKEPVSQYIEDVDDDTPQPSVIASPAKRPPPSIQNNLKFTPRHASGTTDTREDSEATDMLSRSPVRFAELSSSSSKALSHPIARHSSAVLTQSPARRPPSPMKVGPSTNVSATPQAKPNTFLQSPARRPPATVHGIKFGSQKPSENATMKEPMTSSRLQQKPMKFSMPAPRNPFASPERLRAAAEAHDQDEMARHCDETTVMPTEARDPSAESPSKARDSISGAYELASPPVQWSSDADSEDELVSDDPKFDASPSRRRSAADVTPAVTPRSRESEVSQATEQILPMTVLAERFGAWAGATPDQNVLKSRGESLPPFMLPAGPTESPTLKHSSPVITTMAALESSFDEAMQVHEDDLERDELMTDAPNSGQELFRTSQVSDASQEYGDENAMPVDACVPRDAAPDGATCTPKNVFGKPAGSDDSYTVSKVPLKPASEDELPRKRALRAKSLSGVLKPLSQADERISGMMKQREAQTARVSRFVENLPESPARSVVQTPSKQSNVLAAAPTPARTPRPDLNCRLLSGAVVFVDVHTTEGADASEIFVELLVQMGARCVKSWNWTPNSSHSEAESSDSRVGITHVVFKDGGIRTMEKVRQAKGLVQCVGVGWVLDCERENIWMDESEYAIDESVIPRGGHRRRKSMEPRMLSNTMGTLSAKSSPRKLSGSVSPDVLGMSPSKEFLHLDSPDNEGRRRETLAAATANASQDRRVSFAPQAMTTAESNTPQRASSHTAFKPVNAFGTPPDKSTNTHSGGALSPTTPYFLHPTQLEQQTCPPKQTQQLFFPVSGVIDEEQDSTMRHKLLAARRKSLQFAPRVNSPLSKNR